MRNILAFLLVIPVCLIARMEPHVSKNGVGIDFQNTFLETLHIINQFGEEKAREVLEQRIDTQKDGVERKIDNAFLFVYFYHKYGTEEQVLEELEALDWMISKRGRHLFSSPTLTSQK